MNCGEWEEKIALYAGGELDGAAAAEVERHLGQCPGCQVFASGMRESLEWLKSAHQELPDPAHFAAVRARVLGDLRSTDHRFLWSVIAAAVAAAALLLTVWTVRKPHKVEAPAPVVAEAPVVTPPVQVETPKQAPVRRASVVRRRRAPVEKAARPVEPLVVKLVTDDPNVVIYWISETRGGE